MSGSEGGGGGGITHHRDECGFRGGKQEETEDLKMKISCKISHTGLGGVRVQLLTDTGCRAGYGRFISGKECVCISARDFIKTWICTTKNLYKRS